ncbi:MAG: CobW family GTP-binding protein [Parvibaculales bacterium]
MTLPLTILGGYLGAGKTTLINRLLSGDHGKRLTILVNDFGAINIDADLIAEHDGDTISLANGCACCQLQDDALKQLQELAAMPNPPDHILVEASGAGEPARLAYLGFGIKGLHLAGVYVAVAADSLSTRRKDKFTGKLVQRQIAQADFCLLTKTDLTGDDGASASAMLQEMTDAPIATPNDGVLADMLQPSLFELRLDKPLVTPSSNAPFYADDMFDSYAYTGDTPVNIEALKNVLETTPLIRAKGHSGTHRLQAVGERYTLVAAETRTPQLVFIAAKDTVDWHEVEKRLRPAKL